MNNTNKQAAVSVMNTSMKQASPMWTTVVFEGREATVAEFRGAPITPAAWYAGEADGRVEAGPFRSEAAAISAVYAMGDTSGT